MELKIWQVATADMVVHNKTDLVGSEQTERVKAWLDDRLHRYRLLEAERCDVPLDVLLGVGRFDPDGAEFHRAAEARDCSDPGCDHAGHAGHDGRFESWSFETDRPLSIDALRKTAARLWGSRRPHTRIVAIGAAGALGHGDLEKHFVGCLAAGAGNGAAARSSSC